MICLTTKARYKKAIAWLNSGNEVQICNSLFPVVMISHKTGKTTSFIRYETVGQRKIPHGLCKMHPYDFVQMDLASGYSVGMDDEGFLYLAKHLDGSYLNSLHVRSGINGLASTVVIPPDFLKYKSKLRKCFYMKMMGAGDWGRAYYMSKKVLLDMFNLVPTYFADKCNMLAVCTSTTDKIYSNLVSHSDLSATMRKNYVSKVFVTDRCLLRLICSHLGIADLSKQLPDSNLTYSVTLKDFKVKKNVIKSRKSKQIQSDLE